MKKAMLAAVGLTGLLASCGGGVVIVDPVRNFQLLSFQSEYTLPTAYTDTQTGTVYPKGSSIICDNLNTRLGVTVDWDGTIDEFGARLEGANSGTTKTVFSEPLGDVYAGVAGTTFEFTVGPNVAPLQVERSKLGAQAIVVNPVNTFTVKGATFVSVQVQSSDGTLSDVKSSVQALPVANCTL